MAVSWNAVKEGDVLYQKKRQKMGNTTISRDAVFAVYVVEKHEGYAMAKWNGNPATRWSIRSIEKLFRNRPKVKERLGFGR